MTAPQSRVKIVGSTKEAPMLRQIIEDVAAFIALALFAAFIIVVLA